MTQSHRPEKATRQQAAPEARDQPAPVTVSRILADGTTDSFIIENPPARFRIDWESRVAIPLAPPERRWRRR